MDFLNMTFFLYPAIAGVMMIDFFLIRNQSWQDNEGWNWMATIAMVAGIIVGYISQYVVVFGIPAVQSLLVTGLVYYITMKIKAKVAPDQFTQILDESDYISKTEAN